MLVRNRNDIFLLEASEGGCLVGWSDVLLALRAVAEHVKAVRLRLDGLEVLVLGSA